MSRRTIAIAAVLSVLALGSPLVTANANPMGNKLFNNAVIKYEQGDYQGAITDLIEAIKIDPDDTYAYFHLALSKLRLSDYSGALAVINTSLEIDPDDADTISLRGIAKKNLGDIKGACADWEKASSMGDKYADLDPDLYLKYEC